MGKITNFFRELVFPFSLILTIIGIILLVIEIPATFFSKMNPFTFVTKLGGWNDYIFIAGLIIFGIGFYYLYSFLKKSRFVVRELKTNKRSEIQGKHQELRRTVKHLPSKYARMLDQKEDELNIK